MAENYKAVTDSTLADINARNRDMWDSNAAKMPERIIEDEAKGEEEEPDSTEDRAVHLPRRASRKWRGSNFS
jgi:hypothetical protein